MGDRLREACLTISRNTAVVQNHPLQGLKRQVEDQGEPAYPESVYGEDLRPNWGPKMRPTSDVITVDTSYQVVLNDEFQEKQERLSDYVEGPAEQYD